MKPYLLAAIFIAIILYFIAKKKPLTALTNCGGKWKILDGDQILRNDAAGRGHFGAPRGTRTHGGLDLIVTPGETIRAPFAGEVRTMLAYAGYNLLTAVEITSEDDISLKCKILYMSPSVSTGDTVKCGQEIGKAQNVCIKYPNSPAMQPHIHVERWEGATKTDPEPFIKNLSKQP